ncbi:MAG: DUF1015 domain-containing protein [Treponema sp.]|nr:DUF1015 domain-containing protein [Treponema sp.]MCL2244393.1 DUF1015 domain-containing protein [Treponema sp.]
MNNYSNQLKKLGLEIPSILLPGGNDIHKWPVIACDQFTQDRGYWEKVKEITDSAPSTLNLIFPEVFLSDSGAADRIGNIHSAMRRYLQEGFFSEPGPGFIYVERDTPFYKKRRGLIAAVDLEQYDWAGDARPLIRCTEGTVEDRLPPRMDIRRGAPLELPHVLLLIDDDNDSLLPSLGERVKNTAPCYDTQLMMDSGNVKGWLINKDDDISFIIKKIEELYSRSFGRYDDSITAEGKLPFLFAAGDGNHSLAAAKGIWEEYKKMNKGKGTELSHPCRYALAEIENIYDPAIQFEPIHRLVFDIGFDDAVSLLSPLPDFSCRLAKDNGELSQLCAASTAANCFGIICEGRYALIQTSAEGIATACLQPLLDNYTGKNFRLIDYIHDGEELFRLANEKNRAGILLPPVQKTSLFKTVGRLGPLPRKSFSMGYSCEKRFYLECRKLF